MWRYLLIVKNDFNIFMFLQIRNRCVISLVPEFSWIRTIFPGCLLSNGDYTDYMLLTMLLEQLTLNLRLANKHWVFPFNEIMLYLSIS
ncbi:hypothetical protein C0J52_26965 [Blattella germanica]|nr:hypothetical protein C0J52_26965 [Blattella germanica]